MDDRRGDTSLGPTYGQVRLAASDPGWPEASRRLPGRPWGAGVAAAQYSDDRRAYTAAKAAFLQQLLSGG
jgi:hypothetical protein